MEIRFDFPDVVCNALNLDPHEIIQMTREYAAIGFYQDGRLSLGKAAELAGMDKFDFMEFLGQRGVPVIRYSPDELVKELEEPQPDRDD